MKCKNCNVTLSSYLDKCPLCNKKVDKIDNNNPYNNIVETFSTKINVIYFSKLIIKFLLIANIITIICNICINKTINWSLYVLFGTLYFSSFYLFLIIDNKKWGLIINVISLESLLFIIAFLTKTLGWFIYLVGPIILQLLIFILLNYYLSKYNNILRNFSCILIYIAFFLYTLNALINIYKYSNLFLSWSIISNIPLLIISIILFILSFNKKISEEIEKRFFI